MDPDFFQAHVWLGAVYLMKHRIDEAIAEFKMDESNAELGLIAYAYGMAGRKTEARQMLEASKKLIDVFCRGFFGNRWRRGSCALQLNAELLDRRRPCAVGREILGRA